MSLATAAANLLREAGVSAEDILREAGVDREEAVVELAERLGVDFEAIAARKGDARVLDTADVAKVREGLEILNRAFQ